MSLGELVIAYFSITPTQYITYFYDVACFLVIQPLDDIARFSSPIWIKKAAIQYCAPKTGPTPTLVNIFWLDYWNAQFHLTPVLLRNKRRRENGQYAFRKIENSLPCQLGAIELESELIRMRRSTTINEKSAPEIRNTPIVTAVHHLELHGSISHERCSTASFRL
jgi:hypothetical protein